MNSRMMKVQILKKTITERGMLHLPSNGRSMFPLIQTNDKCYFEEVRPQDLKKGDIILFHNDEGTLITHRFFHIDENNKYIFKGDANLGYDQPVSHNQIIGKLMTIERNGHKRTVNQTWLKCWGWIIQRTPILWDICRNYGIKKEGKRRDAALRGK